jgi:hypothetical protein
MQITPRASENGDANSSTGITGFFNLPVGNLRPYKATRPMPYGVKHLIRIRSCPALFGDALFSIVLPQDRISLFDTETVCEVALEFGESIIRAGIKLDDKWIPAFFAHDTDKELTQ